MTREAAMAASDRDMRLRVLLPTEVLVDEAVDKIIAEAANGSFCLLPRHIDFVAALVPGVMSFTRGAYEYYAGLDRGILVKCAGEVTVSTLDGVRGDELGELEEHVRQRFLELDEHERKARSAVARLEAGTLRTFRELQERSRG